MASNYTQLYYHFVWATRERQPLITPPIESDLYTCIRRKCEALRVLVLALNGMPDHVHLACSLPTHLAITDFIETIKGSSAHFINHRPSSAGSLYWQSGYGALTFSKRDLPRITHYIDQQKTHHHTNRLSAAMEHCSGP
jgi:REP element-mobilizing transposase RayT